MSSPGSLLGGLGRRLGRRALLHLLRAAAHRGDDDGLRGQAGRHARRRGVLAGHRGAQGRELLHRADRVPRGQARGPGGECILKYDLSAPSRSVPRRRAGRSRHHRVGRAHARGAGASTIGGRPRPAGRSPPIRPGSSCCRSSSARRRCRCPATTCRSSSKSGEPLPAGELGTMAIGCRCRRGPCRRCGTPMGASCGAISRVSRLLRDRRTPGSSTRTAMSRSWRAPTTSSTSPGTGSRPGAMEEVLASHPDVAECAVIGVDDALKGQLPMGFLCPQNGRATATTPRSSPEVRRLVRDRIGPVAAFKEAVIVERLPKTRSGKILRGVMGRSPTARTGMPGDDRRSGDSRRDRRGAHGTQGVGAAA